MAGEEMASTDELRGSAPAMTTKDLLLEVYRDMKFVRPAVEGLLAAGVVARIEAVEREDLAAKAAGLNADLVGRVAALEGRNKDEDTAGKERRRLGDISTRALAGIVMVSNFILGIVVLVVNALTTTHH